MTPDQEIISLTQRIPKWEWWNTFVGITAIVLGVILALLAIASYVLGNKVSDLKDKKNSLETQILKDFQAPRKLSNDQINQLITGLRKVTGPELLVMNAVINDEGMAYREQILDAFARSGIRFNPRGGTYAAEIVGVTVSVKDLATAPQSARDIVSVFKAAGVPVNFTDYWKNEGVQIIFGNKPHMR